MRIIELFSRDIFYAFLLMDKILREQNTNRNKLLFTLILRLSAVYNKEGIQKLLRKEPSGQPSVSSL